MGLGLLATSSQAVHSAELTLAVVGTYGTWVRSLINGTLGILFRALHVTLTLPGTVSTPIKTRFTGIYWPVDYLLDVLVLFFYQAVDGSHPQTSLFGLYFAAQHIGVITTLYLDSYRSGKSASWKNNVTLWLLIFQLTGIAVTGPLFVLLNMGTALSHSFQLAPSSLHSIRVLPLSILSGYVALVVLMALPSSGPRAIWSPEWHQIAIVSWNVFPLFLIASQYALEKGLAFWTKSSEDRNGAISVLRRAYGFGLFFTVASHAALLTITVSTVLFPTLFDSATVRALRPFKILQIPLSHASVPSLGAGAIQFMQWDLLVGALSVLIPAAASYRELLSTSSVKIGAVKFGLSVLGAAVLLGPGGAIVLVRWLQDEELFARQGQKAAGQGSR